MTQPGRPIVFKLVLHLRFGKQLRDFAMACSAGIGDRVDPGRQGAVVPMAVVAGRCAQIALFQHRLAMDALFPLVVLVVAERPVVVRASRHALLVGVAAGTRFCDVRGIDRRVGVVHCQDAVMTVAIDARGDRRVDLRILALDAGSQAAPVAAGPVLLFLVGARRGVVLPHVVDVRMAAPTKLRDHRPADARCETWDRHDDS